MKICILGAGKMGTWLGRALSNDHSVGMFDVDEGRLGGIGRCVPIKDRQGITAFSPDLVVNCISLTSLINGFEDALPFIPASCILSDLASIKGDLPAFYRRSGRPFVSFHPMFGPTFADIGELRNQNAVIIRESDPVGKKFIAGVFRGMGVTLYEYSFDEHDLMMAYSLTLPFVSSLVFSSCVSTSAVPGTTFRKHLEIAKGLLSEDDSLLAEIIFNEHSLPQLEKIVGRLNFLWHIVKNRDYEEAHRFFGVLRKNIGQPE